MTANRDPDRRLRAWLDLMSDEAPDRTIAAVLQATEHAPQKRDLFGPALRRFPPMKRVPYAAAAAVILAVVAGGAFLFRPGSDIGGPPTASPLVSGLGPGMGYATAVPDVLATTTWIADVDVIQGLFHDARIRLGASAGGQKVFITYKAGQTAQLSQPVTGAPGSLSVVSLTDGSGCKVGDYGVYELAASADGHTLTFTLVFDDCGPRASLLARPWTRE